MAKSDKKYGLRGQLKWKKKLKDSEKRVIANFIHLFIIFIHLFIIWARHYTIC